MGGGGAMRTAAKIAGISTGLQSSKYPTGSIRRATAWPVEEVSWAGITSSQNPSSAVESSSVQRPAWELDDWEFAGDEGFGEPLPRVVFGTAPSLEEAKNATDELKDALDKIYLSPQSLTGNKDDHESTSSMVAKQEDMETKACVISESTTKSLPTNALKAFRLLNESSAAQSVVASIASDPNVWHAVLQNEALAGFLQSQKSTAHISDSLATEVSDTIQAQVSKSSYEEYDTAKTSDSKNWFVDFLESLKSSVTEKMNVLSDYIQDLFGGPSSVKVNEETDGAGSTFTEKAMGASFMGLAVLVIMLVVLKRP